MTTFLLGTNRVYLCVLHKTFKQTVTQNKLKTTLKEGSQANQFLKPHTTFRNDLTYIDSFTFKIQLGYLEIYRIKLNSKA